MMNAKRNTSSSQRISLSALSWVVIFISIISTAGVICGFLKNQCIKVNREIVVVNTEIQMHENDANYTQMKINERLGYFEVQKRLAANNSRLVPIKQAQMEIIVPSSSPQYHEGLARR